MFGHLPTFQMHPRLRSQFHNDNPRGPLRGFSLSFCSRGLCISSLSMLHNITPICVNRKVVLSLQRNRTRKRGVVPANSNKVAGKSKSLRGGRQVRLITDDEPPAFFMSLAALILTLQYRRDYENYY